MSRGDKTVGASKKGENIYGIQKRGKCTKNEFLTDLVEVVCCVRESIKAPTVVERIGNHFEWVGV